MLLSGKKNAGHLTGLFAISLQLHWLSSRRPHVEASDLLDLSSPASGSHPLEYGSR